MTDLASKLALQMKQRLPELKKQTKHGQYLKLLKSAWHAVADRAGVHRKQVDDALQELGQEGMEHLFLETPVANMHVCTEKLPILRFFDSTYKKSRVWTAFLKDLRVDGTGRFSFVFRVSACSLWALSTQMPPTSIAGSARIYIPTAGWYDEKLFCLPYDAFLNEIFRTKQEV